MSQNTYGDVYREAYDSAVGTHKDAIASGIAAVARHVFAEGMAAYLAEQDKQVEPPKPEAASEAGDWAMEAFKEARDCISFAGSAKVIREAANRHYRAKFDCAMNANAKLIKERDAARAECERLRAERDELKRELAELKEPDDIGDDLKMIEDLLAKAFVGKLTTILGKGHIERWQNNLSDAKQRAEAAEAERDKLTTDRDAWKANYNDMAGRYGVAADERDELRLAWKWSQNNHRAYCGINDILAAFRATKRKEQGDGPK